MTGNIAHIAALRLIRTVAEGGATPETALSHIARLATAALGPEYERSVDDADVFARVAAEAERVEREYARKSRQIIELVVR